MLIKEIIAFIISIIRNTKIHSKDEVYYYWLLNQVVYILTNI
jgi:hypothetical protein